MQPLASRTEHQKEALCKNMGCGETYLRKHYSHYLARLATADLMKMRKDIGLGGKDHVRWRRLCLG